MATLTVVASLCACGGGSSSSSGASSGATSGGSSGGATSGGSSGGTSSSGPGGTSGASSYDAGLSPELLSTLAALANLRQSGSADLDGDGITDVTFAQDDAGNESWQFFELGTPNLTVTVSADGPVDMEGQLQSSGVTDFVFHGVPLDGGGSQEDERRDLDLDGLDDLHVARTFQPGFQASIVEEARAPFDDGGAGLIPESQWSGPSEYLALASRRTGCSGKDGFPTDVSGSVSPLGANYGNVRIVANGTPGSCTGANLDLVTAALNRALLDMTHCLETARPEVRAAVYRALLDQPLDIACGNTCNPGTTDDAGSFVAWAKQRFRSDGAIHMNLNTQEAPTVDQMEEVMIHELIHWAGFGHDHDAAGNGGHDMPYSCGRYCNGCATIVTNGAGLGTAADHAADCANCRLDRACGEVAVEQQHDNSASFGDTCTCGFSCLDPSQGYISDDTLDCAGNITHQTYVCTTACPPSSTPSYVACTQSDYSAVGVKRSDSCSTFVCPKRWTSP